MNVYIGDGKRGSVCVEDVYGKISITVKDSAGVLASTHVDSEQLFQAVRSIRDLCKARKKGD